MTFWCDAPLFDLEELEEKGRRAFETRFKRASLFRPYVGERGFYAWDINERIGLGRLALSLIHISASWIPIPLAFALPRWRR